MRKTFLATLLLPLTLLATDFNPFYPPMLYIDLKADYIYQNFQKLQTDHRRVSYNSNDHFLHLAGAFNYDVFSGEAEITGADTRHRTFGFDEARLTGRYQILSDYIDDTQSLVVGVTAMQTVQQPLEDPGAFHHGKIAGLAHVAFGKEYSHLQFWTQRYWGMFGFGSADVGSPWIEGMAVWDRNFCDRSNFRLFAKGLFGFGGRGLDVHRFRGYGPVAHRSIDLGFRYNYVTEWCGTLGIGYAYRVYARNFPSHTHLVGVHYEILLGTGI